ncbi:hypothetical protein BDV06DRAFT_230977 [Aspergillus oleicola]
MGPINTNIRSLLPRAPNTPYFTPPNNPGAAFDPTNPSTPTLFRPLKIRNVTLKNRIIDAPMCKFSCEPNPSHPAVGALTDWHVAYLGHLATKGVGMVIIEATAVTPNGRISPQDSGLWQGVGLEQWKGLKRVVDFVLRRVEYKWAPGDKQFWAPRELSSLGMKETVEAFARSAKTAIEAGVDVIEVHAAHGYLLHEFLSPVTNRRTDAYGGSFDNRDRIVREVLTAIRAAIPPETPLLLRISATDCLEDHPISAKTGSWDIASTIRLARLLPELGVDLLDVSSTGNHREQRIQPHSSYQVDVAGQIRREIYAAGQNTLVGAVGLIREQMRPFMREPNWVFAAAKKLWVPVSLNLQFGRALL